MLMGNLRRSFSLFGEQSAAMPMDAMKSRRFVTKGLSLSGRSGEQSAAMPMDAMKSRRFVTKGLSLSGRSSHQRSINRGSLQQPSSIVPSFKLMPSAPPRVSSTQQSHQIESIESDESGLKDLEKG